MVDDTLAVFDTSPAAAVVRCTTSVNVVDPPLGNVAQLHVTVGPVEQLSGMGLPPEVVSEENVVFVGSVSVSERLAASDGPVFATVIV